MIGQLNGLTGLANFPTGDPAKPAANSLNSPSGLALDASGNLWVADSGNGRVLRFPAPFAATSPTSMPSANLVIGQASFTAQLKNATANNLSTPVSLGFISDGSLLVTDEAQNRVLYFQQPLTNGMAAAKVIGQTDFFSSSPNGTPVDPARFSAPIGLAVDSQDRFYVCDSGGARVAIFGSPAFLQTAGAPPVFSLSKGLQQPVGIAVGPPSATNPGELWVADPGENAIVHFPAFTKLSQTSVPDGSTPVNTPLGIAYDAFSNLVVADGTSRVLFYVPLISVVNSANYLSRAVAPGTIVSIFPSPSTSNTTFSASTVNFNSLPNPIPLPTALGGTQVLVNQQPSQLFYMSPTQINLPLSMNLPTSGTVDLRVVNQATGQIYGGDGSDDDAGLPGPFHAELVGHRTARRPERGRHGERARKSADPGPLHRAVWNRPGNGFERAAGRDARHWPRAHGGGAADSDRWDIRASGQRFLFGPCAGIGGAFGRSMSWFPLQ